MWRCDDVKNEKEAIDRPQDSNNGHDLIFLPTSTPPSTMKSTEPLVQKISRKKLLRNINKKTVTDESLLKRPLANEVIGSCKMNMNESSNLVIEETTASTSMSSMSSTSISSTSTELEAPDMHNHYSFKLLPLPGGTVHYYENAFSKEESLSYLRFLMKLEDWKYMQIFVFGRPCMMHRKTCAFSARPSIHYRFVLSFENGL